ncbi:hypothetical protein [Actinocatenispora sera]|jgi:hypothetical protein|uniref:Uncharacterized protein n=1 Tax=Actinocatenispora sera TaxID=390989 RepID=A0A810KW37_9ACTN|nr:hypothetical protein [Actinocatenispora sera]BCJ27430.1 hypothetical protein Asera_15380 [Actinocatenispora sera]
MRHAQTAVLERGAEFTGEFATEPYELPWAAEARFFVQVIDPIPGTVTLTTQLSPDGLNWIDAEHLAAVELDTTGVGMVTWRVREFGGWLRLRGVARPADAAGTDGRGPRLRIHLVAKE